MLIKWTWLKCEPYLAQFGCVPCCGKCTISSASKSSNEIPEEKQGENLFKARGCSWHSFFSWFMFLWHWIGPIDWYSTIFFFKNPALILFTLKFPIQWTMEKTFNRCSLWFHCPCREIRTHFLKCLFLALESINVFPQFWQMWGLSPVWILTCVFRWLDCLKFFPQKLQW